MAKFYSKASLALSVIIGLGTSSHLYADDGVTWADIENDAKTPENVLMYGMGPEAQRYSGLDQINKENVHMLSPAWVMSFGDEKQRGQESQAIVYDGIVYVTGSYSRIYAYEAKTGKKLWDYAHRLPEGIRPCCDVVNRGAAIYGDLVFFGTLDAGVVALDRLTGKVKWKKRFEDYRAGYTMTGAPTIVKDQKSGKVMLIHGSSGDEFGVVGKLFARDPETGEELLALRPMGRTATGVRGIRLQDGQKVVSLIVPKGDGPVLTATENGFGKRTPLEDYPAKSRATQGVVSIKVSERNGKVVGAVQVDESDEIMLISDMGTLVRTRVSEVSTVGRNTQGVRLIRTADEEKVVGLQRIEEVIDEDIDLEDGEENTADAEASATDDAAVSDSDKPTTEE
mgnify:CR=1 FL=1